MKNLRIISISILALGLSVNFYSCNSSKTTEENEEKVEMVTKAFDAKFTGTYIHAGPDTLPDKYCMDSLWRAIVNCKGTSNIMGDIEVRFDFCGAKDGNYGDTYAHAYMLDKNNDTLFISVNGTVIQGKTEEHPPYVVSYWKDDFEILGGSGKYEGASGGGKTDDYNSSEDPNSHHNWKGTITLKK